MGDVEELDRLGPLIVDARLALDRPAEALESREPRGRLLTADIATCGQASSDFRREPFSAERGS
jgi:hypothetical protein